MKRIQVICFYWEGERWQPKVKSYGSSDPVYSRHLKRTGNAGTALVSKYVNNLFAGVARFAEREFDFICFTNKELDLLPEIEVRSFPMVTDRGVLPRMYMFSEDSGLFGHQVLCFDIDVVLVGGLEPLMAYNGLFCARSKFLVKEQHKLDGDVMSFRAGPEAEARFWTPFIKDVKAAEVLTQGRERYWVRHVANDIADRWENVAPGTVLSFKRSLRGKPPPPKAVVVSFHGFPRPHQATQSWVKEYWK